MTMVHHPLGRRAGSPTGTGVSRLAIDDPRWMRFVEAQPAATMFHHPAWASLLAEAYRHPTFVLGVLGDGGEPRAGLPIVEGRSPLGTRRWLSLPFTDFCPPLGSGSDLALLAEHLRGQVSEHRIAACDLRGELPADASGPELPVGVRHTLDLSEGYDIVRRRFRAMHRRNTATAERSGAEVRLGSSRDQVREFYRLHLITRRRLGVPIQPWRFFDLLQRRLLAHGFGFVASVYLDGSPIAAAVFLGWRETLIYKYGASDPDAWKHRPNNLLFDRVIRLACDSGYRLLDWGRTELDQKGLRDFKSGWAAREEPLRYTRIGTGRPRPEASPLGRAMTEVIRRSPLWVCRGLGELLYRYAA